MILFKNEEREIFSIHINYRYAEKYRISNEDFLKAHLAEHLIVVDACREMQNCFDRSASVEKYVSGLTNIENSCFQLSASNEYIDYVNEFIKIVCNHKLNYITEHDFSEQVENVLKEYEYPENSYQGRCSAFFNFINALENVNYEEEIYKLTFDDIKKFIEERFVLSKCDIFYCGKSNEIIKSEASLWARHTPMIITPLPVAKRQNVLFNGDGKKQVWFAYQFYKISSSRDYFISEIVAKTIQIVIALSNKVTLDTPIFNVGTHYTENCSYALFYANTTYDNLCFDYSCELVCRIIDAVKEEYRTRLLLKNDSLLEKIKFYKKLFYITTEDHTEMDIKSVFEEIKIRDIYSRFEEVYTQQDKAIMEYTNE